MEFVIQPLENSADVFALDTNRNTGCTVNTIAECGCIHNTVALCGCAKA